MSENDQDLDRLLDSRVVCDIVRMSRSALFKAIAQNRFPAPDVKLSRRFARWKTSTVVEWLRAPAAWSERRRAEIERGGAA